MKTEIELIVRSPDKGEHKFDASNTNLEISDDFTTYRLSINSRGQIEVYKITANGLDTIIIEPVHGNKVAIY